MGSFNNVLSLARRYVMSNFCSITSLHHHQKIHILDIVDDELTEAIGHHVSGLRVTSVTDTRHQILSLESSSYSAVNSFGFSPTRSDTITSLRLVTDEPLPPLLNDHSFSTWYNHCHYLVLISVTICSLIFFICPM